jgi:solute carrier family 20 (sodium-dependent phosphate transporter)
MFSTQQVGFLSNIVGPTGARLQIVYAVFGYMQVISACFMSFAQGGIDVSNAYCPWLQLCPFFKVWQAVLR